MPVVTVTTGSWQPNPAAVGQTITSTVTASVSPAYQSANGDSISKRRQHQPELGVDDGRGVPVGGRQQRQLHGVQRQLRDWTAYSGNYAIEWAQGSATTGFNGIFNSAGYYIIKVIATLTYHDNTTGKDVGTYSGTGYIGGSASDLASSGSASSGSTASAQSAMRPMAAGTATGKGVPVVAKPVLSAPNPSGRPDLGDGSNQFVYNVANDPTGGTHLNVPAVVSIPGASAAAAAQLAPNLSITYDIPAESKFETNVQAMPAAGQVSFQTTYNTSGGGSQVASGLVYTGLPTNNSGFGNHLATLTVSGSTTQQAHVQTFFMPNDISWPDSDSVTPNWYHYYNQVYPSGGNYTNTGISAGTNPISVGNDAHGPRNIRIFGLSSSHKVYWLGQLQLGGIHNYIYICGHEQSHVNLIAQHVEIETKSPLDNDNGDGTGDGLNDNWETRNGFDPNNTDTTGAYKNLAPGQPDYGKGDREAVCDINALVV